MKSTKEEKKFRQILYISWKYRKFTSTQKSFQRVFYSDFFCTHLNGIARQWIKYNENILNQIRSGGKRRQVIHFCGIVSLALD